MDRECDSSALVEKMSISGKCRDDCPVLCLADFNLTGPADELREALEATLNAERVRHLVVDFADVSSCSSSVINCLLLARKRTGSRQGTIRFCSMTKTMREKFRLLALERLFEIFDSLSEALEDS